MYEHTKNISSLLREKKIPQAFEYVKANGVSFHEYYVAIKKNTQILSDEIFWQSELPLIFLSEFLNSPLKTSFYENYFSKDEFCNSTLNKALLKFNDTEFGCFFKLFQCHRKKKFMNELAELSRIPSFLQLALLWQKMQTICDTEELLEIEETDDNIQILQLPFDKILLGVIALHEAMMQSEDIKNNIDWQTMYDAAIVREAERIINLYVSLESKESPKMSFGDASSLNSEWAKIRPNHKFEIPREINLSLDYILINDVINRGIQRQSVRYLIAHYLAGNAEFEDPFSVQSIKFNEGHSRYRLNDLKSRFEEIYFYELPEQFTPSSVRNLKASFETVLNYYNIPEKSATRSEKDFEIIKAHKLLSAFSTFKSPLGKSYLGGLSTNINEPDDKFKNHFGSNEHISIFDEDDLIKNTSSYFGWSESESRDLISILTTDLLLKSGKSFLLQKPFLKVNDKVFWLGRLMKNRRWDSILRNKLKQDRVFKRNSKGKIAVGLEDAVKNMFLKSGFKVLGKEQSEFTLRSGEKGEVDLLAYRNGELVIAEVKSGLIEDEPSAISETENLRLEGCASEQLEKINNYIAEFWDSTLKYFFEAEVAFNDLKKLSLIVTDFFEGDLKVFKGIYHKISLIELDVILNNKKSKLLKLPLLMLSGTNANNPEYLKICDNINWDLWGENSSVSIEILKECIEKNKVWREVEQYKEF